MVRKIRRVGAVLALEDRFGEFHAAIDFGDDDELIDVAHRQASNPFSQRIGRGTCPVATCRRADSTLTCESSKKMSAPNASRNGPLSRPPRNSASSRRTPQLRR